MPPSRPAGRPKKRAAGAPPLQDSVADLRALAHPLRLRMMELFAESPRTTKQVAELLGEPPTRLYHHAAALERAGLIAVKETRQRRGAVEKLYAAEKLVQTSEAPRSKDAGRATRRALAATVLEQAKREMQALPAGASDAALLARMVLVVPPAAIADVRRRLYDAIQEVRAEYGRDTASGDDVAESDCVRWAITLAFAPVWPGGGGE